MRFFLALWGEGMCGIANEEPTREAQPGIDFNVLGGVCLRFQVMDVWGRRDDSQGKQAQGKLTGDGDGKWINWLGRVPSRCRGVE